MFGTTFYDLILMPKALLKQLVEERIKLEEQIVKEVKKKFKQEENTNIPIGEL